MMAMLVVVAFFLALLLTWVIRQYARQHLLDIPNQRSSHQQPTPRGGGLAIVLGFFAALSLAVLTDTLQACVLQLFGASLMIAAIGFWDDHQALAARWRILVHIGAAAGALLIMPGLPALQIGAHSIEPGVIGWILALLFLVWMLNLFNFMDGIDGLAASEAVYIATALGGFMLVIEPPLALPALALAAASLGFLFWNWPPAKIFMGDVGSGFLGFVLGLLILWYAHQHLQFLAAGLILSAVFITDASLTLLTRLFTGQRWYQAHCSHAYQQSARQYGHLPVVLAVWAINLCWLLPLAALALWRPGYSALALLAAYAPLIYLARRFQAGNLPEKTVDS